MIKQILVEIDKILKNNASIKNIFLISNFLMKYILLLISIISSKRKKIKSKLLIVHKYYFVILMLKAAIPLI